MKVALAAVGFINGNIQYNKEKIVSVMREYAGKTDIILFGETFLQGFDSLSWVYDRDKNVAVAGNDCIIDEIRKAAVETKVAVSFGYVEREKDTLFSSQLTIGSAGQILDNYRRISRGWKERVADTHYCEGEDFETFEFDGKKVAVALCGDLWDDGNIEKMRKKCPDIVLWPVYTDFGSEEWNTAEKYEYAEQVKNVCENVLYVNSVRLDSEEEETAHGGAAWFKAGKIVQEIPSGKENVLTVSI